MADSLAEAREAERRVASERVKGEHARFFRAVDNNDRDLARRLAKKVDVNIVDPFGSSLLHHAVTSGSLAMVRILVESKANVNGFDQNGLSALHLACSQSDEKVTRFLLLESQAHWSLDWSIPSSTGCCDLLYGDREEDSSPLSCSQLRPLCRILSTWLHRSRPVSSI